MKQENYTEKSTTEQTSLTERFSNKQKIIATLGIVAAFGGSVLFYNSNKEKPSEQPEPTTTEQSTPVITPDSGDKSINPPTEDNKVDKKTDSKKQKEDKNTSYKYCPDIKAASCTIEYKDPGSGETVLTTPNKSPENVGENPITFLGFAALINDYGMTFDQVKALRSEFKNYSKSLETPIKELSITVKSVETTINPDTADVIDKFTVTVDRESTLNAEVEYFGIDDPSLKLYNPDDNTQVYGTK